MKLRWVVEQQKFIHTSDILLRIKYLPVNYAYSYMYILSDSAYFLLPTVYIIIYIIHIL